MLRLVLSLALLFASRTSGSVGLSVGVDLSEVYASVERLRARGGARFLVPLPCNRWCKFSQSLNIMTADLLRVSSKKET
jgi:hypothetical protein